jgi:hypothetical protein
VAWIAVGRRWEFSSEGCALTELEGVLRREKGGEGENPGGKRERVPSGSFRDETEPLKEERRAFSGLAARRRFWL